MQLHDMVTVFIKWHVATLYFTISSFINISSINELTYRKSKTSLECVNVKCKVTKCVRVNSFVEALTWYVN